MGRFAAIFALSALISTHANAESPPPEATRAETQTPVVRGHRFPLEPGKLPERPIQPETYVAGATSAPSVIAAEDVPFERLSRKPDRWTKSLGIGWAFSNQVSKHSFTGAVGAVSTARRSGINPLSADLRFELLPPIAADTVRSRDFAVSVAMLAGLRGGFGRADFKPLENPGALIRKSVNDWRADAGLRLRALFAGGTHAFWLGSDVRYDRGSALVLEPGLNTVHAEFRRVTSLAPRVEYRYEPADANWGFEAGGGFGTLISAKGDAGATTTQWKRAEADARAMRHLTTRMSLGVGASWARESSTWVSSAIPGVADSQNADDIRVQFLLRTYF